MAEKYFISRSSDFVEQALAVHGTLCASRLNCAAGPVGGTLKVVRSSVLVVKLGEGYMMVCNSLRAKYMAVSCETS